MAKKIDLKAGIASLFLHDKMRTLFQKVNKNDTGDAHEHIIRDVFEIIRETDTIREIYLNIRKDYPNPNPGIGKYVRAELESLVVGSVKTGLSERINDKESLITSYTKLIIV